MSGLTTILTARGDGSYAVTLSDGTFLGFVRKLTPRRWIAAPLGTGVDPAVEVTEHTHRREAVARLLETWR